MSFCSKCGSQVGVDEKFCGVCGTPVGEKMQVQYEGQAQDTPQVQRPVQQVQYNGVQQPVVTKSEVSIYFSEVVELFKNMLLKPATTITKVDSLICKEASFILAGVLAIIYGILSMWSIRAEVSNLTSAARSIGNTVNSINPFGGVTNVLQEGVSEVNQYIPYPKIFLFSFVIFIVFIGVMYASIYLIAKHVLKSEVSGLSLWKIVVSASIPYATALLLQVLVTYISIKIAIVVSFFGIIISAFVLYKGVGDKLKADENKTLFMMAFAYVISLIVTVIIASIMLQNFILSMVGKIF
jgi:hypothetical protein